LISENRPSLSSGGLAGDEQNQRSARPTGKNAQKVRVTSGRAGGKLKKRPFSDEH
jgi:hypothetical protein